MKNFVFLLQQELTPKEEVEALVKNNINFTFSRLNVGNSLVIPRYGLLPFEKELYRDIEYQNSLVINSLDQHNYIKNFEYYEDISDLTPKTFFNMRDIPDNIPLIVKGVTNSKKQFWNTKMFANNKKEAMNIAFELQNDTLLNNQDIIFREYVPLEVVEYGINDLPFANEWRFFVFQGEIVSHGFYWIISEKKGKIDSGAFDLVNKVICSVGDKCNFYVVDVAKTAKGDWAVIELNDGCMSGLSENDPNILYSNIAKKINANKKILF